MKEQKHEKHYNLKEVVESYCQVCFVGFNRMTPKKLQEGQEICLCVKCKCRVHKSCYDMELNSSFVNNKLREFICDRCQSKELVDKSCIICHKKQGALKKIGTNEVIHVFCGLMHNQIMTTGYFPQITFRKGENYKEVRNVCGLCSKPNATEQCAMESCFKRYHGYCIWLNFKNKQIEEEDPQCEKYYFSCGDNGNFDLTNQLMHRSWVYQEFDKVLETFEQYGFKVEAKDKIKERIYEQYEKEQKEDHKNESSLKRGGFAYILCRDHESSMYCNCMNRGSGDMVQCECCFQWYHQTCVSYQPSKNNENYICTYCHGFYDLKKKIIEEVKSSRIQGYQLKFETPKMNLNDFIWLLRVIDHRIAGGLAAKMVKELAKYPLKTSKMELVVRNQNKKKLSNLTENFIQKYLESEEHEAILKPKPVLGLDEDRKPTILYENVEYNKKLKKYVDFIQNFVRKNNLPDSLGQVIHELRFKERAIEDNYETILELSKSPSGFPEVPILKIKVEEYSFMEVIKDIDSGSMIRFEDLENAVIKAKSSSANVPSYLLKPLIQRYEKVKNLVQFVSKNIHQKKESSSQTQNAVRKLKQQKILPPQAYLNFHQQKKFINELYLFYLKQQGKSLQQSIQTPDKIQILLKEPACRTNREIAECVNQFTIENQYVFEHIGEIVNKYSKMCVLYELRECIKKKSIKLSTLQILYHKYVKLTVEDNDPEILLLMNGWKNIRQTWIQYKSLIQGKAGQMEDIAQLTDTLKGIEKLLENLKNLPIEIVNKAEEAPQLGSVNHLQILRNWIETLTILFTQAQLRKNPMTIPKLPEGIPRQNPLVKEYYSLKKQQNQLMSKYNSIYTRINQKIQILKADMKKPRNQQMKDNLEKPRMNDINHFIDQLKESRVSMDGQIKQLTKSVNKSIQIGSRVNKFMAEQKHLESLFKEEQIDSVKKQIDELRKKVLIEAQICLENELKDLYVAEICVRMQKMVITSNAELDKMSKLLKFAQEQGLNHLSTYKRLKSKFEVGNQSTKQINLTKKHEQFLNNEAQKLRESDQFYSALVFARKSLPLSIPQPLKQKNKHYEELLSRNEFLKTKIGFILSEEPKKYQIEEAKPIYLQALKHPFEIQGLNKLISQFQKAQKVLSLWKQQRQIESSRAQVFTKYDLLIFHIEEISSLKKSIKQCQQMTINIKEMKQTGLELESLCTIESSLQSIQLNQNISKNSKIYYKFKNEYYSFWIKLLQKFNEQKIQTVPFGKIKSILTDIYSTIQKNIRLGYSNDELKSIVNYLEDLMIGIRTEFQNKGEDIDPIYEGFIDLQQLKYEVSSGLNIKDQIKILNPFNDLIRFNTIDLQRNQSQRLDEEKPLKRQRSQIEFQDPYLKQNKNQRSHKNISSAQKFESQNEEVEDWEKNESGIVSQAQRNKAKQVILNKIKSNPELQNYQNLEEQVRMIQNQLFGENHNQIIEYFKLVESIEKLFIKLSQCPHISAKVAKKKFEWKFLMLLIQNFKQINQIETMLVEKSKEGTVQQPKQGDKKQTKEPSQSKLQKQKDGKKQTQQKKQKEPQKQKSIQEMIASGKVDESIRKEMKRQIKAIREKNKKKKHKSSRKRSRSRSRSSSKSPDAKFSSDSEEKQLPAFIEKQYVDVSEKVMETQQQQVNDAPLMFDPQQFQNENQMEKKTFTKGITLQIKNVDIELTLKKKGKISFKGYMMSNQDYERLICQFVDPGLTQIQLRRDKAQQEIIQYLNKPSRKKYRFLVGWLQGETKQQNQSIRDFAIQCNQRGKIFGIQNQHVKMHVMSIHQYVKIVQFQEPPKTVTSEAAAEALKNDRLIFIIQFPTDKMYELKGLYQNYNDVQGKQKTYPVEVPQVQLNTAVMNRNAFMPNNYAMGYNPIIMQQQPMMNIMEPNPLKPVQYQGWGSSGESTMSTFTNPGFQSQNFNPLNSLSRFSPILTDQQDNNADNQPKQKQPTKTQKQIDLASNILNSIADVNIKSTEMPQMSRNYSMENRMVEQPRYDMRYQPMQNHPQMATQAHVQGWQQHPGMMSTHPQHPQHSQMGMGRMNMPYNPMSMVQHSIMKPPPSVMYKNPMMPVNPYQYQQQQQQQPQPNPNQPKPYGSQQYAQHMYDPNLHRRQ